MMSPPSPLTEKGKVENLATGGNQLIAPSLRGAERRNNLIERHYMEIASPPVRGTRNDIPSDILMSERLRHFGHTTLTKRILLTRKDILC